VSAPDSSSPAAIEAAPKIGIRFLWWIGIYLGFQLPLIRYIGFINLFPQGLGAFYPPDPLVPNAGPPRWFIYGCYSFYLAHLILTFALRSRRAFRILMIILIVVAATNMVGCMKLVNFDLIPDSH
jgi:Na+-driven multidrug efflux pump